MAKKKAAASKSELPLGNEPGVGRVVIPELDKLADTYKRTRDRRQDLTLKEVDAKQNLEAGVHKYADPKEDDPEYRPQLGRDAEGVARYVYEDDSSPTGLSVVVNSPTGEQTKVQVYRDPGAPEE